LVQLLGLPKSDRGHVVLQCEAIRVADNSLMSNLRKLIFAKSMTIDTVTFSQDLATLMEAGVTVKEAIQALTVKETAQSRRQIFEQLNTAISEGLSFSAALERMQAFPVLLVATVAASEQTGDLATGLSRCARHQQSLRTVRDRVVGVCV